MTKYSAPSIEVVNFSSADAPRIGMQWWVLSANAADINGPWLALPGYTPNLPLAGGFEADLTSGGVPCSAVRWGNCTPENIPNGYAFDTGVYPVADDGRQSC